MLRPFGVGCTDGCKFACLCWRGFPNLRVWRLFCTQNPQNFMKREATRNYASGRFSDFCGFCVRQIHVRPYSVVPPLSPLLLVKVLVATLLATPSLMAMAFTVVVALRVKGSV